MILGDQFNLRIKKSELCYKVRESIVPRETWDASAFHKIVWWNDLSKQVRVPTMDRRQLVSEPLAKIRTGSRRTRHTALDIG